MSRPLPGMPAGNMCWHGPNNKATAHTPAQQALTSVGDTCQGRKTSDMVLDALVQSEFSLLASLGLVGCIKGGEPKLLRGIAAAACSGRPLSCWTRLLPRCSAGDGAVWLTGVDLATLPRSWGSPVIETGAPLPTRNMGDMVRIVQRANGDDTIATRPDADDGRRKPFLPNPSRS